MNQPEPVIAELLTAQDERALALARRIVHGVYAGPGVDETIEVVRQEIEHFTDETLTAAAAVEVDAPLSTVTQNLLDSWPENGSIVTKAQAEIMVDGSIRIDRQDRLASCAQV